MRLSTKGRYGVRAMFELALHHQEGALSLKRIAQQQEISEKYLEHLFASLKKGGLINSTRGAHGGYRLSREPEEITVGDIIRILEGSISFTDCVDENLEGETCKRIDTCVVNKVWSRVRDKINEVVDDVTLADMCEDYRKSQKEGYMYYI